ncbi:MAG: hypothetical protein JWN86_3 [Planctomycetota bacterium]|nr:hypothetical protein [Planctomycetota bacterium]
MTRCLILALAAAMTCGSVAVSQEAAKPKPAETDADRDAVVMETVLKDLVTWPDSPAESKKDKKVRFSRVPREGKRDAATIVDMNKAEVREQLSKVPREVTREASADLVRRIGEAKPFKDYKPKDERIILWKEGEEDKDMGRIRPQVFHAYAPGYSKDHKFAVVRLGFPWSIHSGEAVYALAKRGSASSLMGQGSP